MKIQYAVAPVGCDDIISVLKSRDDAEAYVKRMLELKIIKGAFDDWCIFPIREAVEGGNNPKPIPPPFQPPNPDKKPFMGGYPDERNITFYADDDGNRTVRVVVSDTLLRMMGFEHSQSFESTVAGVFHALYKQKIADNRDSIKKAEALLWFVRSIGREGEARDFVASASGVKL